MAISLYSLAYLFSLTGLVLWFFYEHKAKTARLMSTLFLGAFVVYAFSLAFSPGEFSTKLWVLFRDMMVLGAASQVFIWAKRSQWVFFALLILTYGFYFAFYQSYMQQSFTVEQSVNLEGLDENAELLVGLKSLEDKAILKDWLEKNVAEHLRINNAFNLAPTDASSLDEYVTVDIPSESLADIESIANKIAALDVVLTVEQNEKIFVNPTPSTLQTSNKLGFSNDPELKQQWAYDPLDIDKVHQLLKNISPTKGPAKIAILDTGVDAKHEDLKSVFYSIDKKSNTDPVGHGTHCAGIAGAVSNNSIGISSMAPTNKFVKITSVKVLSAFGGGTQQSIIQGIIKAADAGVDVISMSLGGPSNDSRQKAYGEAVKYANKKGAIVVVAAGNSNTDGARFSPANAPGVIAVGAIGQDLKKASFSNTVNNLGMGISAPGAAIFSTIPKNKYIAYNGTSMACPQVAGLIGIMRSIQPELSTKEVYDLLQKHGKSGEEFKTVGTMIQPFESLKALVD